MSAADIVIHAPSQAPVQVSTGAPTPLALRPPGTTVLGRLTLRSEPPPYLLGAPMVGPPGPAGSAYVHTQASALTTWTIPHNLGYRPTVTVTTLGGAEVIGGEVIHLSVNTLQIDFDIAFAGQARLT